jgi:hypothetical protein
MITRQVFCRALFAGASKLLAERGFRRGQPRALKSLYHRPVYFTGDSPYKVYRGGVRVAPTSAPRRGPLDPADPASWAETGMLKYPQCRKAVLPPSSVVSASGHHVALRSARPPPESCRLRLDQPSAAVSFRRALILSCMDNP